MQVTCRSILEEGRLARRPINFRKEKTIPAGEVTQ